MTFTNKPAWLESQYLYPHHFQQQERYLEERIERRGGSIAPFRWGFSALSLDRSMLAEGQLALSAAEGVMPDGTPFRLPVDGPLPRPLQVPAKTRDQLVYAVLPVYQPGSRYMDARMDAEDADRVARYRMQFQEVYDYAGDSAAPESVETAVMNMGLAVEGEDLGGYTRLPVARVREVTQEGAVLLDGQYIPPCLYLEASEGLRHHLVEVIGLLQQRGEALAARFVQSGRSGSGGSSAIADFLLLQLVNRCEPRLRHLSGLRQVHPERLYAELIGLMGELATFTTEEKRPLAVPPYRHDDLQGCFAPLMDVLQGELSAVLEQKAIALPVEERQYGIRVSRPSDRSLLGQARFVLAARADMGTEAVREQLPQAIKVGSVETIRNLVNNQLPGIAVKPLPMAPREIPYHAGNVYFELDTGSEQWRELRKSGGFAFHLAGDWPGLKLEFWAIRE